MSGKSKSWLEVDREGLAQVLGRRGPEFVLYELAQNAWDAEGTTHVNIEVHKKGKHVTPLVEDDSPKGWCDLTHAWTLFAPSEKKADPTKRGRFNLGDWRSRPRSRPCRGRSGSTRRVGRRARTRFRLGRSRLLVRLQPSEPSPLSFNR